MLDSTIHVLPAARALVAELGAEGPIAGYLERLRSHHEETWEHSFRVGLLSADSGLVEGLDPDDCRDLGYAGLLHDVGKLRIPREVLQHHGLLDPASVEVMREHSRLGFLEVNGNVPEAVRRIVVAHHEFSVDPYPRRGNVDRPPASQLERRVLDPRVRDLAERVALVDMFDALLHRRRYKPALPPGETERLLRKQSIAAPAQIDRLLGRHHAGRDGAGTPVDV